MTFGEKLQKLRAREGLSQDALAELLDVSRQAVSKWERDEAMPETEKVVRISNCFQVTTDYLLKDGPEKFPDDSRRRAPDLGTWYRRQGYLLGWGLVAWGAVRTARMLPTLSLMIDSWYTAAGFLLGFYLWPGLCLLVVGVLVLWRRCCGACWGWCGWRCLRCCTAFRRRMSAFQGRASRFGGDCTWRWRSWAGLWWSWEAGAEKQNKNKTGHGPVLFFRRIGGFDICALQKVVNADMVKIRESAQNLRRQHPLTAFIICVCPLGDTDGGADLRLGQIRILPQVPNPVVHIHHPSPAYPRTKYSIYFLNILF